MLDGVLPLHCRGTLIVLVLGLVYALCVAQDDDSIAFDGPVNYGQRDGDGVFVGQRTFEAETDLERSLRIARELNQLESIEDFMNHVKGETSIYNRLGDDERSNVEIAKAATCSPHPQPVFLKNSSVSSSTVYYPSCTRVPRCGGCCGHVLYSCEPTASVIRNFQVFALEFVNVQLTYRKKLVVPIEEHTKCACSCIKKAKDCNEKQIYMVGQCGCVCSNTDEQSKCFRDANKRWDPETCTCECKGLRECTTGFYYDDTTCSCKHLLGGTRRRHADDEENTNERSSEQFPNHYIVGANDPRRKHKEDPL